MNNKKISIAARTLAIGVVAALVLAGTAMGEVTRTGLVGEWHFDGDAKDTSGNGNDGKINGATFVDGKVGKALSFNGVNDYVSTSLTLNTVPKTYSAWIKLKGNNNWNTHWIVGADNGAYNGHWLGVINNKLWFEFCRPSVCDDYKTTTSLLYDKWYFVAASVTSTTVKVYVNGILENDASGISIGTVSAPAHRIGEHTNGGYNFNGIIDEVRIYNRALSDSEIKVIYEESQTPPAPQLTLTKSLSPSTITEGDSTTVTIRVENTGGDAKSVKITDAIPQGFTLVSGSASQEYATLKATESRTFQYTLKATGTGRFVSDLATVTYQDEKGNSYSGASNSATITVQAGQSGQVPAAQPKTPGFGAIIAGIGMILALAFRRR